MRRGGLVGDRDAGRGPEVALELLGVGAEIRRLDPEGDPVDDEPHRAALEADVEKRADHVGGSDATLLDADQVQRCVGEDERIGPHLHHTEQRE